MEDGNSWWKYNLIIQIKNLHEYLVFYIVHGGPEVPKNLWCCMTCAEYLMEHPTNILSNCFDHMCDDLNSENIGKRIDQNIEILMSLKSKLGRSSSAKKPKSIWEWMKQASIKDLFKSSKWPILSLKVSPIQKHLMLLLLIAVFLFIDFDRALTNPFESTPWLLLQTLGG